MGSERELLKIVSAVGKEKLCSPWTCTCEAESLKFQGLGKVKLNPPDILWVPESTLLLDFPVKQSEIVPFLFQLGSVWFSITCT